MTTDQAGETLEHQVRTAVAAHHGERGALLPILRELQDRHGYVDQAMLPIVAAELNLSRAEVHGVASFYHDFRSSPPGRTTVRICRAEACQSVGAEPLAEHARQGLGVDFGQTTADGAVTLEQVFCFGNCALGPAVEVAGRLHGRVSAARLDALLAEPAAEPAPLAAPQLPPAPQRGAAQVSTAPEPVTVYVPGDSAARSVGADEVAQALLSCATAAGRPVRLVRNGSRGALWLEPLVEVRTAAGRVGYGPVSAADVAALVAGGLLDGAVLPGHLGLLEQLPWLREQTRVTFARVGVIDPLSVPDYLAHGGLAGLRRALRLSPAEVVDEVTASGLRGRGGAGFPAGIKWRTVLNAGDGPAPGLKFICCNADEGDSGTFADRMLMEGDPFTLIEGMVIAAHAVGAREGYVYVRSEYPDAVATLRSAIEIGYAQGWLGRRVLGSDLDFDLAVRVGAGAYICGEETSMLESLEGRRPTVRAKPPIPALSGLFGRPTVVNNVLTLATVPMIMADGGAAFAQLGVGRSRGTQVFQLAGNVARGGIVEAAFGVTLGELVNGYGGGSRSGRPVRAVQAGGPLGSYLPVAQFDLPMDYEAFAAAQAMVGHGGLVVFDDTADLAALARFAFAFCAAESCGKCTPCRVGAVRGVEVIDRIVAGEQREANLALLDDLCELMVDGSLCAMGGLTPMPVRSALRHFPEDFGVPSTTTEQGAQ